jgi:hypothetical protein
MSSLGSPLVTDVEAIKVLLCQNGFFRILLVSYDTETQQV